MYIVETYNIVCNYICGYYNSLQQKNCTATCKINDISLYNVQFFFLLTPVIGNDEL